MNRCFLTLILVEIQQQSICFAKAFVVNEIYSHSLIFGVAWYAHIFHEWSQHFDNGLDAVCEKKERVSFDSSNSMRWRWFVITSLCHSISLTRSCCISYALFYTFIAQSFHPPTSCFTNKYIVHINSLVDNTLGRCAWVFETERERGGGGGGVGKEKRKKANKNKNIKS